MRSDYALYILAIIFFIITGIVLAYQVQPVEILTIITAIIGIFFIGLGYTQRPKARAPTPAAAPEAPPPLPAQPSPPAPTPTEAVEEKAVEIAPPAGTPLTQIKGIGEKRTEQLKALGINTVEELAKASPKELASKLKVSPKITQRWVENAQKLTEKS
ncbi:MAG: DUF4332 domain-containing protein [Candidatus Bathyarchaeia archaeon]